MYSILGDITIVGFVRNGIEGSSSRVVAGSDSVMGRIGCIGTGIHFL